jgi:uncharacterized protein YbjT (DUF2867 family)
VADPVLVLGATGTQGGAIARELLASKRAVRALVRDPLSDRAQALSDAGASLVEGDLRDTASLGRAFAGVEAAYAITTPFGHGADEELEQGENTLGARAAIQEGRLPIALPADKPLHQVALADLGTLVVAILGRREEHLGVRVEVRPRQLPEQFSGRR